MGSFSNIGNKKNRVFLVIIIWLLIGVFIGSFHPIGVFILMPLIPCCVVLFILSLVTNIRELSVPMVILIIIITVIITPFIFFFGQIIGFLYHQAILSYVIIVSLFSLFGAYLFGKSVDEYIYTKFPSPLHHITRWFEFLGGVLLGIYIIYLAFIFTGSRLNFVTMIIIIAIIFLAAFSIIFLLTGKFNAWLGMYSIYAGLYFAYLVLSFLFARELASQPGGYPLLIRIIITAFDILILLYTTGILLGRGDIISKKIKIISADTILMWLIFSKAAYELAILINPSLISITNRWLLLVYTVLVGIVGLVGIFSYKKYKKKKK